MRLRPALLLPLFLGPTLLYTVLTTAEAQPAQGTKAVKIGFLCGGTLSSPSIEIDPFKQTLREKGWIEGRTSR